MSTFNFRVKFNDRLKSFMKTILGQPGFEVRFYQDILRA